VRADGGCTTAKTADETIRPHAGGRGPSRPGTSSLPVANSVGESSTRSKLRESDVFPAQQKAPIFRPPQP